MKNTTSRRNFLYTSSLSALSLALANHQKAHAADRPPNVVLIFIDDLGYGDIGSFGAKGYETPNLDRMAGEGVKFTDFYVAQPVCGASRAALLTGCYPNRIGLRGAPNHRSTYGIHEDEMTIAEMLKQKDYATACFGKWHLGHHKKFLPKQHGFDEYYGLPYSNDMWPFHPENPNGYPPLPLVEGDEVIELNPDQTKLTTDYTERSVNFINKNKDKPFFLYLAHSMVHVPLFVSDKFKGKSEQGLFGDVMMEIDWSVGQVLEALNKNNLDDNTLVIFTSDNGPWLSYGDHAGTALPLREGKGTTWDGGVREPTLMRWTGTLPEGEVCSEPCMTIDILPTIAKITDTDLPEHTIDGKDIFDLMRCKPGAESPQEAYYFYWNDDLQAIRSGKWKLHFPHAYRTLDGRRGGNGGIPTKYSQAKTRLALYDLENDIGEKHNVAKEHPDVVTYLTRLADTITGDIGNGSKKGPGYRPAGKL